jgi:hypothetical protein
MVRLMKNNKIEIFLLITLGEIECELPNNNLNRFEGTLKWKNEIYPLKNDNILLRGTKLRNTQWVLGGSFFDVNSKRISFKF